MFPFLFSGDEIGGGDADADVGVVFNDDDGAVGGVAAVPGAERDPVREVVEYYGKCIFNFIFSNLS